MQELQSAALFMKSANAQQTAAWVAANKHFECGNSGAGAFAGAEAVHA
ncbi:MAG: hypothetical protein Q8M24_07440 [Pseudolabrys sp.]|nr:hypothetical protein [Pseudolabrys sp.]